VGGSIVLGLVVLLLGSGFLLQFLATESERRAFPPMGRLVDAGGYRLHLYCVGTGSPAVVFESGFGLAAKPFSTPPSARDKFCFLTEDVLAGAVAFNFVRCLSSCSMFNIGQDIHSLTDFKRRTSDLVAQLHETKRPIVLTVNGRPEVVVQEAEAYQQLLDRLEQLEGQVERVDAAGGPS
jgi:prevent-host-death family protein